MLGISAKRHPHYGGGGPANVNYCGEMDGVRLIGWSRLDSAGVTEVRFHRLADAAAGASIAVRIMDARHAPVCGIVIQQTLCFIHDAVRIGTYQLHRASGNGLGPLRLFP